MSDESEPGAARRRGALCAMLRRSKLVWVSWIGVVLAPTCIAGVVAVGWLSRRRVPILTTIGLILAVVGFTCLAVGNTFGELSTALVASHPDSIGRPRTRWALGWKSGRCPI